MKLNAMKQNFDLLWLRKELCRLYPKGYSIITYIGLLSPQVQEDVLLLLLFRRRFGFFPTISNPVVENVLDLIVDDFDL